MNLSKAVLVVLSLVASSAGATVIDGVATHYRWEGWVNTTGDLSLTAPPVQFGTVRVTCWDGATTTYEGYAPTNALGRFSWTVPTDIVCARVDAKVVGGGSEQDTTVTPSGYSGYHAVVTRAAWASSPDNSVWVRRVTAGRFPVFFIEGFDPDDTMKTGVEASIYLPDGGVAPSLLSMLAITPVGLQGVDPARSRPGAEVALPGKDLLTYLGEHDYGLYLVTAGPHAGNSIRGSSYGALDGQAYQTATVIRRAMQLHTAQFGGNADPQILADPAHFVVGGYSMGGLIAKYAVKTWCADAFAAVPENELRGDACEGLVLWFAGDSPLRGAQLPLSVQRLVVANDTGDTRRKLTSPAAREMLTWSYWPTANPDTNCVVTGCDSSSPLFMLGDAPDSAPHDALQAEVTGAVMRRGVEVPAFIFSVGTHPVAGATPNCTSVGKDSVLNSPVLFADGMPGLITTRVDTGYGTVPRTTWGPSGAGRVGECVPGSTYAPDLSGPTKTWWAPTQWAFIPSASALEWDGWASAPPAYADYWYSQVVRDHSTQLPPEPTSMLLAWLDESLKGHRSSTSVPVTGARPGFARSTRFDRVENPFNGIDDDGDDNIDNQNPARSRAFYTAGMSIADLTASDSVAVNLSPYSTTCFPLSGITVSLVGLSHTWVGDLKGELLHLPASAGFLTPPIVHPLFDRVTSSSANKPTSNLAVHFAARVGLRFETSFAGEKDTVLVSNAASDFTAAGFVGEDSCGSWWVRITDLAGADVGNLSAWRLTLSRDLYR